MKTAKISLNEACDIAIKEGKVYRDNLANKRFLVIYRDRDSGDIKNLEVVFRPSNYQHLTGLDFYDENGELLIRESFNFYRKCVRGQLLPSEIGFHDSYTSLLKLECLPRLMEFTRITRIAGRYNETKPLLEGDYLLGGINGCIAVSLDYNGVDYFPRSALSEDIRNLVKSSSQVLAILRTAHKENKKVFEYSDIFYQAKGVDITKIRLPDDLIKKISIGEADSNTKEEKTVKMERKKSIIKRLQENQRIIEEREKNREPKPKQSRNTSIED